MGKVGAELIVATLKDRPGGGEKGEEKEIEQEKEQKEKMFS